MVNLFIAYKLDASLRDFNTVCTLKGRFLEAVKITENADPDKYSYFGYGIGFESRSFFVISKSWGENFIIFEVGNSSPVHTNNKKKMF